MGLNNEKKPVNLSLAEFAARCVYSLRFVCLCVLGWYGGSSYDYTRLNGVVHVEDMLGSSWNQ